MAVTNKKNYGVEIDVSEIGASALVTESDSIASNDNDTTIPTSAAVKDYVDAVSSTDLNDTTDLTYNADTDVSANGWVLDEDNLATDSATKLATQQSIKAYVDASGGGLDATQIGQLMLREEGRMNPNSDYSGASLWMDSIGLMNSMTYTDSTAFNGIDAFGVYFEQRSSASNGADHGWFAGYDNTRIDHLPLFKFAFQLSEAVTNLRFFIGLANMTALGDISDADDFGLEAVGFQYSTGRSDTTFQAITDDGTTQTVTDTGVTVTTDTFYEFEINVTATSSNDRKFTCSYCRITNVRVNQSTSSTSTFFEDVSIIYCVKGFW